MQKHLNKAKNKPLRVNKPKKKEEFNMNPTLRRVYDTLSSTPSPTWIMEAVRKDEEKHDRAIRNVSEFDIGSIEKFVDGVETY